MLSKISDFSTSCCLSTAKSYVIIQLPTVFLQPKVMCLSNFLLSFYSQKLCDYPTSCCFSIAKSYMIFQLPAVFLQPKFIWLFNFLLFFYSQKLSDYSTSCWLSTAKSYLIIQLPAVFPYSQKFLLFIIWHIRLSNFLFIWKIILSNFLLFFPTAKSSVFHYLIYPTIENKGLMWKFKFEFIVKVTHSYIITMRNAVLP